MSCAVHCTCRRCSVQGQVSGLWDISPINVYHPCVSCCSVHRCKITCPACPCGVVNFVHTHSACSSMQYMPQAASRATYNVLLCHQLNLGLDIPNATGVHDNPHSRAKPRRNLPSSSRAHAVHADPLVRRRGTEVIHGRHRSESSDLLPCVGHHDGHRVSSSCAENPEVKATRPHIQNWAPRWQGLACGRPD